jgi:hypothetical protein
MDRLVYRPAEIEAMLKEKAIKAAFIVALPAATLYLQRQQAANATRSKRRARVELVYADQQNAMGGKSVRTLGIARPRAKMGKMKMVYNRATSFGSRGWQPRPLKPSSDGGSIRFGARHLEGGQSFAN